MIRLAMVAVCSFGFGVVLMDTLHEKPKPAPVLAQLYAPLGLPIQCDATVCQNSKPCKCYVAGMRK